MDTNIAIANNQTAANKIEEIFNRNDIKSSLALLAKMGCGVFKKVTADIHDLSGMDDNQVREAVAQTFKTAKDKLQSDIEMLNSIPTFDREAKNLEDAAKTFLSIEKEILDIKDMNVIRKGLLMFWTGVKYIAGLIVRSCIAAGKFVLEYGIRIIAVGVEFIVKIVQKTVQFFKSVMKVAAAVRVAIDGTEKEIIDVEASEYY